nr:hypothetical protein [Tanacetum cinerariifolium]
MDEAISVAVIIDKLPPSWKEFKHSLKHKKEELNLVQLGSHLRNEEGLRNKELDNNPKGKNQIGSSSINMVERDGAKNSNNNKNKRKFKSGDDKFANKKGTITCCKCKKTGHMKKDCRSHKGNDGASLNGSMDTEKQQDKVAWWVDSGATSHVCKDLRWFQVCKSIEDGSFVKMGNVETEPIKGIGRVLLNFTSEKTLCLDNVLYVPRIRKNLVSEIMLNKCGYKQVLESDKYCYVNLLNAKHEALDKFKIYKQEVELQRQDLIKVLHTDRGGEYYDSVYFQSTGIIHQTTAPYTPQQNGVAERKNGTLKEMVNFMLSYYGLKPNDYVLVNSIIESRDAIFDEERFTSILRPRGMIQPSSRKIAEDEVEEDPRTLSEAMASRDVAFRKKAVQSEIDSIMHNDTWELTDLPLGCKALGCKWILKRKMKVDESIAKYKDRLVIQGFRQNEGIDFFDTYAPVARISTIRLLLALAAIHDLVFHQMDVQTAFLNGDLDEEIYMKQPEGFVMSGHESKTKEFFSSKSNMNDLGEAEVILGIKRGNNGTLVSQLEYSRAIRCLMYAMISTRLDIAFAVGKLKYHWSTSGWVFFLGGGAIFWALRKQTCITSSTIESEFMALAAAGNKAEWLRNLVYEIPLWPKLISTISIRCDSAATLAKAYSQVYNAFESRVSGGSAPGSRVQGAADPSRVQGAEPLAGVEKF